MKSNMKKFMFVAIAILVVLYMAFAFVNWDLIWVVHVGVPARCLFISLYLLINIYKHTLE